MSLIQDEICRQYYLFQYRRGIRKIIEEIDEFNKERKLTAKWSVEMEEDLEILHGVDMEKELVEMMGKEIIKDIKKEIKSAKIVLL